MNVLLIDNFDSFTYNLYQYLGALSPVHVVRNNAVPMAGIRSGLYSHIVISPGPGDPTDPAYFGQNASVIDEFHKTTPLLGICLGHQGIGAYFGASIVRAPSIMHGKTSTFAHTGLGLMRGLPSQIEVMRYHSLTVDPKTLPSKLLVDAVAPDGAIMAFHHPSYPIFGLQFHPESFRTPVGMRLITNFLETSI